jgi:membrane protease YdiL (CAAX protease family)
VVLAAGVYTVALYFLFALLPADVLDRGETDVWVFVGLQFVDDGVLAAVGLAFGRWRYPRDWTAVGFRRAGFRWLGLGVAGGILAAAAGGGVSALLGWWGFAAPVHPVETVLEEAHGVHDVGLVLATVALVVPFAEEVFFRGFAYRVVRARLGVGLAMVVTTAGFALVHGLVPGAWLPVVPIGLVLAFLVERSGSLWPPIVAHATVNALAILVP